MKLQLLLVLLSSRCLSKVILAIKFAYQFSSDPRDINPLFDAKEFRSPQFHSLFVRRVLFIYPRQFALHLMNGGGRFPGSKTFVLA